MKCYKSGGKREIWDFGLPGVVLPPKQRIMRLLKLTVFCLAVTFTAQAQESELDPVSVTAAYIPEKTSKTGRNIITVKGERFHQLPVSSVDELLRFIPGVEMQMRGPAGSQSDISLRGSTFQQVLVLLDGLRLNDPNTGHFSSYIPIAPAEIDRIEILKGAASAIYGSEAVGGVIHIITKSFAAKYGEAKKSARLQATAGEYDLLNLNLGGIHQGKKTSFGGGLLSNNTKGQPQRGTRGFYHNHTGSVSFNHFFNENWNLSFRSAYDSRDFSAQNFYTTFVSDTAKEKVNSFWNQLRLGYQSSTSRLTVLLGYKNTVDEYRYNSVGTPNKSTSGLGQASLIYERRFGGTTTLTSGIQYQNKSIRSNDRGNHQLNQTGVFTSLHLQPVERFTINPSVRVDFTETIGAELVPQLNLAYRISKLLFRASAGKTIRDADFTERYNNYNKTFVASGRIGNPDLEAERSFSYEAGVDYLASAKLKMSGTFFQRHHDKLIDYVVTAYANMPRKENLSPTGTYALARNIASVRTTGAELDFQFTHEFGNNRSAWAAAGLLWLEDKSSEGTPSFYISSHAKYLLNFNLGYRHRFLGLSLSGVYKKRNPQSAAAISSRVEASYFVMNAKVEAWLLTNRLSLFVLADNLTNEDYQDLLGSQMPRRWLMGGLQLQF